MIKYLLSYLLLLFFLHSAAQPPENVTPITLDEAIEKAAANNWKIKQSNLDFLIAEKNFNLTKAAFLPQVNFSLGGVYTNDPLQAFGLKLKKQDVVNEDFNPTILNDPDPIGNVFSRIEARQSIFQLNHKYKKAALNGHILAAKQKINRVTQATQFEVENTYYQLQLLYRNQDVIFKAQELLQEYTRIAKDMLAQNLLLEHHVLQLENRLLELDFEAQQLQNQIITTSDYLCYLLQCDTDGIFLPQGEEPKGFDFNVTDFSIESRDDLSAIQSMMHAQEMMKEASKKEFLPQIYAYGAYELNDFVNAQNFMLGIQLNWNIYDGGLRAANQEKIQIENLKMHLEYDHIQAKDKLEIQKYLRVMELAKAQYNLLQKNVEHTEKIRQIITNRFQQGLAKTTDILEQETQLTKLNLELLKTQYQFHFAKIFLEFLLG